MAINKDNLCLFITTVTRNRLPVFRTDAIKTLACRALDEARGSGGFALFAYVIMRGTIRLLTAEDAQGRCEVRLAAAEIGRSRREGAAFP